MSLDDQQQQEIAETLYHAWKVGKNHACLQRKLSRVADALEGLAAAIRSEMEGSQARKVVRRTVEQKFDTTSASLVSGPRDVHELPEADDLASLTDQWRAACVELEKRKEDSKNL